jgi:hypothetical protein
LDYTILKFQFSNRMKNAQNFPGAEIDSQHSLNFANIFTRLRKIVRFLKRKPRWDLQKLYAQQQKVQDVLKEILLAMECESGKVELPGKSIKKCVLVTMSDLFGKLTGKQESHGLHRE